MLLQVNPDSAQTVVGESGPVVSDNDSEPPRYQVFHIEHSPNVHKIFIPTSFPRPAGYLYFVTDLSLQDHPQTTLPVTADVLKSSEQMGDIYQSRFVGYIASQDLDRMRAMIKEHSRPLVPGDYAPLPDYATRCEVWTSESSVYQPGSLSLHGEGDSVWFFEVAVLVGKTERRIGISQVNWFKRISLSHSMAYNSSRSFIT
ncbi:hypothetical protein FCULG_00002653 [Fusarium culmorum]|uniref:Uncharacterized protein n=1 Tax=Fusarium culmorum TaxID=5516 RepID=A0A2T4GJN6_FUSCU|nr:hypothetical protein FCULG_00002653 [Fusarium culmorum]